MKYRVSIFSSIILIRLILAALIISGCSGARPVTESVRFALIGNTAPESPFTGFNMTLPDTLEEIDSRKPQIIIHTGNALYGGSGEDGILESDVRRQLNIFFPMIKKLKTAIYTIPGKSDLYNGTPAIYLGYSGRELNYSFNYGSIHFICIGSVITPDEISDLESLYWLKEDLQNSGDSTAVFVITHYPINSGIKKGKGEEVIKKLHQLFLKYNVKGVFSGYGKYYNTQVRDNIWYVNAGCYPDAGKRNRKNISYYIIDYKEHRINIDPVK